MALDKSVVKRISFQIGLSVHDPIVQEFAEAIYALGVSEERDRCADLCEEVYSLPWHDLDGFSKNRSAAKDCAEAIRKGE